jgi:hypothetical protein
MAPNHGFTKRLKERARQDKQKEKELKRQQRRTERGDRPLEPGEDPDIAGIVPGPQPPIDPLAE